MEPFVVKHYASDERPTIKGNGFDGLEIGEDREEAERFVAFVNAAVAAERKSLAQRLQAEAALDGFGCACTPQWVCGTCTARETISKALAPLMRELGA